MKHKKIYIVREEQGGDIYGAFKKKPNRKRLCDVFGLEGDEELLDEIEIEKVFLYS